MRFSVEMYKFNFGVLIDFANTMSIRYSQLKLVQLCCCNAVVTRQFMLEL